MPPPRPRTQVFMWHVHVPHPPKTISTIYHFFYEHVKWTSKDKWLLHIYYIFVANRQWGLFKIVPKDFKRIFSFLADSEGITTVAVKTLKESATEVDRKDLLSELEVSVI